MTVNRASISSAPHSVWCLASTLGLAKLAPLAAAELPLLLLAVLTRTAPMWLALLACMPDVVLLPSVATQSALSAQVMSAMSKLR